MRPECFQSVSTAVFTWGGGGGAAFSCSAGFPRKATEEAAEGMRLLPRAWNPVQSQSPAESSGNSSPPRGALSRPGGLRLFGGGTIGDQRERTTLKALLCFPRSGSGEHVSSPGSDPPLCSDIVFNKRLHALLGSGWSLGLEFGSGGCFLFSFLPFFFPPLKCPFPP